MLNLYCRIYQLFFRIASYIIPWRRPKLFKGANSLTVIPNLILSNRINKVLIITDKGIIALGLLNGLLDNLNKEGIKFVIYYDTVPNPQVRNVEEALQLYKSNQCKGIIAFGGGSSIDCAKAVGACVAKPNKPLSKMKGLFKIRKKTPILFAVPTTAGTGSEATITAVISDSHTHEKYTITDMVLTSNYAILDPLLTIGLPQSITATTGIDALTHAIEAYIGKSNTRETKDLSIKAIKLIFENLFEAYTNGTNLDARENMLRASCNAGSAFARAYVGYVHAMAHAIGGFYNIPHGLAVAIILPYVLEYYGKSVYKSLAEIADAIKICDPNDSNQHKAKKLIEAIRTLNAKMNIQDKFTDLNDGDIPLMIDRAFKEANPLYPVPKILNKNDLGVIFKKIKA